jgi:hypothetical protein
MRRTIRKFSTALPRWLAALTTVALAASGVVAATAAPASAAAGLNVYVGYADTLRPNPTNFPTPWSGSPGVQFSGCTTSCSFDAGAVRFVNDTSTDQIINHVTVTLSTCTFDMWAQNITLHPGDQYIITQTASGASGGCDNAAGFFDTSDIGPNGANWSGNCNQSGVIPQINATIDGVANTFTDSQQVLNTGGVDLAVCPPGTTNNESQQWSLVGTRCPGASISLAPQTQTDAVGTTATVQATVANSCGTPLEDVVVTFVVLSGPNAGLQQNATTDTNGVASFSYSSSTTGTDTLQALVTNPAGTFGSNDVTVVWQKRPSTITITSTSPTSDFNDPGTVSATLTDNGGPVSGQPIVFTLNGTESCTATTNSSGAASCSITPGEAAGAYPLTAAFAGDATDLPSSATVGYVVTHEETSLAYTGPTKAANGASLTLSGVLTEDGTTPISGRTVTFALGSGASAQTCSGTTNASGSASCTIASVNQPASSTAVGVSASFAGDAFYLPSSASATLKFLYLTGRAYGLSSSGLVTISPTPDTGAIQTASAGTFGPPCVVSISGLISADTLCAKVVTTVNPGTSTATASVQDATIGVLGLPVIKVGLVESSSTTDCTGSTGAVTVSSISVGGIPLNINVHPGPNTTINVLGVTIVLNEQTPVAGPDQGLTVNAVHIKALGLLDVVLASATSDINNC